MSFIVPFFSVEFTKLSFCDLSSEIWAVPNPLTQAWPETWAGKSNIPLFFRLGLLGPTLGLHPTGGLLNNDDDSLGIPLLDDNDDSHAPLAALSDPFATSQCCCFDKFSSCPDPRLRASSVSDLMNSSTTLETETTVSPTEVWVNVKKKHFKAVFGQSYHNSCCVQNPLLS